MRDGRYYTEFSLTTEPEERKAEVLDWARSITKVYTDPVTKEPQRYRTYNAICEDEQADPYAKWYEHQEDMRCLSRQFPDVTMKLYGKGEDCYGPDEWDEWVEMYKDGKMTISRVVAVELTWEAMKDGGHN